MNQLNNKGNNMPVSLVTVSIVCISLIIGFGSRYIFKKDDNKVEELAEEIIFQETGYYIDLTPLTPEDNDGDTKLD